MKYIFANHKMNLMREEADRYIADLLAAELSDPAVEIAIFPTAIYLSNMISAIADAGQPIKLGAQNCYFLESGAVTGEISAGQLKGLVDYVLVGHSERRQIFDETDNLINQKVDSAINHGLTAVLCVGENRQQYEQGQTESVITEQLSRGLSGIDTAQINNGRLIIAYEPVWAIGGGVTPSRDEISSAAGIIKRQVKVPVLYGGSANETNATEILTTPDIDGLLVGGASLNAAKFATIVEIARNGG
jgi:triosephosphate isomerase